MQLSEVLSKYYVMPLGVTAIVGFHAGPRCIEVSWTDPEDHEDHFQEFLEQEVQPFGLKGAFAAVTEDGVGFAFLALERADLGDLDPKFRRVDPSSPRFKVRLDMEVGAPTASEAAGWAFDTVKRAHALTFDVESVSPDLAVRDKITVANKENHNA